MNVCIYGFIYLYPVACVDVELSILGGEVSQPVLLRLHLLWATLP